MVIAYSNLYLISKITGNVSLIQHTDKALESFQRIMKKALSALFKGEGKEGSSERMMKEILNRAYGLPKDAKVWREQMYKFMTETLNAVYNIKFNAVEVFYVDKETGEGLQIVFAPYEGDYDWDDDNVKDWTDADIEQLKSILPSLIQEAERIVSAKLGWSASFNDAPLIVCLVDDMRALAATDGRVLWINLSYVLDEERQMHISLEELITHEITHVLMFREGIGISQFGPDVWFVEGVAEWVAGAGEERVQHSGVVFDGLRNPSCIRFLKSTDYSEGYLAVEFIAAKFGPSAVYKIAQFLEAGYSMEMALQFTLGYRSFGEFEIAFREWAKSYVA
jgi:hypothetical protein